MRSRSITPIMAVLFAFGTLVLLALFAPSSVQATPVAPEYIPQESFDIHVPDLSDSSLVSPRSADTTPMTVTTEFVGGYGDIPVYDVFVAGDYAYVAGGENGLQILDVSNALSPTLVGKYDTDYVAWKVQVVNSTAYVIDRSETSAESKLLLIDVSDPKNPSSVGSYGIDIGVINGMYLLNGLAYIVGQDGVGLQIVNLMNDPSNPEKLSGTSLGYGYDVKVVDGTPYYMYVADGLDGLNILSSFDPLSEFTSPTESGGVDFGDESDFAYAIDVQGNYAYVAYGVAPRSTGDGGLRILDISDPDNPSFVKNYDIPSTATGVQVIGNYAYVAAGEEGLYIIDVSDPKNTDPVLAGKYDTPAIATNIHQEGKLAYIADAAGGLQIVWASDDMSEVDFVTINGFDIGYPTVPYTFEARIIPSAAETPEYTWVSDIAPDFGQGSGVVTYTWATTESHALEVTAKNGNMSAGVVANHTIVITDPTLMTDVSITGIITGDVFNDYTFSTILTPTDATMPITYTWSPEPASGQGNTEATYNWTTSGTYTVVVTANNRFSTVTATHVVTMNQLLAPDSVDIVAPIRALKGMTYTLDTIVTPLKVTNSITNYVWYPEPLSGKDSDSANPRYVWDTVGTHTIEMTATNSKGSVTATHVLTITADPLVFDLIGSVGGDVDTVAVQGDYAYVGEGEGLAVLNITDASNMVRVASVPLSGTISSLYLRNGYVYAGIEDGGGQIVDVTNPENLSLMGSIDTSSTVLDVMVVGDYAYLANGDGGLQIVNVSDKSNPISEGTYNTNITSTVGVYVVDTNAYVADSASGLKIVDVTTPSNLTELGTYDITGKNVLGVQVVKDFEDNNLHHVYIEMADGFDIVDVNVTDDPLNPTFKGSYTSFINIADVHVSGTKAYAIGSDGLQVVDVTDVTSPTLIGGANTTGVKLQELNFTVYIAGGATGFHMVNVFDVANSDPFLVGTYKPMKDSKRLQVVGNYAYVIDEFKALKIIDISNSLHPKPAGSYDTTIYDGFVVGTTAYIAAGGDGLHIVDVSNPSAPTPRSRYELPRVQTDNAPIARSYYTTKTLSLAVGVYVVEDLAYVTDSSGNLFIIDVSNPSVPTFVGSYENPDDNTARRLTVEGNYAYVLYGDEGLRIFDLSNPVMPTIAGIYDTPGNATAVDIVGDYAYIADGTGGLHVVDVGDPSIPMLVKTYATTNETLDIQITGKYAYMADGAGGVQVFDVSAPMFPVPLGNYQTKNACVGAYGVGLIGYLIDDAGYLHTLSVADPGESVITINAAQVSGPTIGEINTAYTFDAHIIPSIATPTINYVWSPPPDSVQGTKATYTWSTAGTKNITVQAANSAGGVTSASFAIDISEEIVPVTGVTISGETSGIVNRDYIFTAAVEPTNASTPIVYEWKPTPKGGQGTAKATYNWSTLGKQDIRLDVSNGYGAYKVADTWNIDIQENVIAPTSVSINGVTEGITNTTYVFTATVEPDNTTNPEYIWSPEPAKGQGKANAEYLWDTAGDKTITVEAKNAAGTVTSKEHVVTIVPLVPPKSVTINGTSNGTVNTTYPFTATVEPITTTTPISYTWVPAPASGQGSADVTYSWDTVGAYTLAVTAENSLGSVGSENFVVTIAEEIVEEAVAPITVTISGDTAGVINTDYEYVVASVEPVSTTKPLAYTWSYNLVNGQDDPVSEQGNETATFNWEEAGVYAIKVTVENDGGSATSDELITTIKAKDVAFNVEQDGFSFGNVRYYDTKWEDFKRTFPESQVELPNGDKRKGPERYYNDDTHYKKIGENGNCAGFTAVSIIRYLGLSESVETELLEAANRNISPVSNMPDPNGTSFNVGDNDVVDYIHLYQARQKSQQFHNWWFADGHYNDTPLEVFQSIQDATALNTPVAVSIYQSGKGGHRMTAYRTEQEGNTGYIYVYDSNWQGDDTRRIEVDMTTGEWSYELWSGFSMGGTDGLRYSTADLNSQSELVFLYDTNTTLSAETIQGTSLAIAGDAQLLITDNQGNQLGFENGTFHNDITNGGYLPSEQLNPDNPDAPEEGTFFIPEATTYTLTIQPTANGDYTLTTFANNTAMSMDNVTTTSGSNDTVTVSNGVQDVSFTSSISRTYCMYMTQEVSATASRSYTVCPTNGATASFSLDDEKSELTMSNGGSGDMMVDVTIDEVGSDASKDTASVTVSAGKDAVLRQDTDGSWTTATILTNKVYLPFVPR